MGVSTRTVRRWIKRGELVEHRFGSAVRVADRDLLAFWQFTGRAEAVSRLSAIVQACQLFKVNMNTSRCSILRLAPQ